MIQEEVEVSEAQLLPEVGVELAVVPALVLASLLGVGVRLVDEEVVGEDVEGDPREVQLVEAGCFVSSVSDEALVTPVS